MTTLRFRAADSHLSVLLISRLRQITKLSIAEIRTRAAAGDAIFEITPFQTNWHDDRHLLVQIARDITSGSLPLTVTETAGDHESPVSLQLLNNLIRHFRQIEIETQMDTMLELGEISDPSEFTPYDEDWTLGGQLP